jgi:putative salt-induced outer membrane protein YdiY
MSKLIAATALLAATGAVRADQLVMKNGDRVTGSIVKKDAKTITIKSDAFGVITAPWDQVVSITADQPVTVVLKEGRTVAGTMTTAAGKVDVAAQDAHVTVDPTDIVTVRNADEEKAFERLEHPSLAQLWATTATLGLAGTAGNAKTATFTTGATAVRATRTDKITLTFNVIDAAATVNGQTSQTARAVRGGVSYDHNVGSRLFLSTFNTYEYDKFQNLDLRAVFGGGLGFHAIKTGRAKLDFTGGGDFNHENFASDVTRHSGEFYWGDDFTYQLSKGVSVVQAYRMFNNLTDTGAYRVNFDLGFSTKLTKWLTWNASASDRYLSNPLPGRKTNDFLYTTGFGVIMSR